MNCAKVRTLKIRRLFLANAFDLKQRYFSRLDSQLNVIAEINISIINDFLCLFVLLFSFLFRSSLNTKCSLTWLIILVWFWNALLWLRSRLFFEVIISCVSRISLTHDLIQIKIDQVLLKLHGWVNLWWLWWSCWSPPKHVRIFGLIWDLG